MSTALSQGEVRVDPRSPSQRRLGWVDLGLGVLVAFLTMAAVTYWRASLLPIDPWDYVEGARNFPNGVWNEVGLSRWGMVLPLIIVTNWWGDAEASYYIYPVLAAGLMAAVLFLLGARLVNRWVGAVGAAFVVTVPVVFLHLTRGYPDLIATSVVSAALLFLVLARDASQARPAPTPPIASPGPDAKSIPPTSADLPSRWLNLPTILWLLAAGFAVGWAFEVRELTALAWPGLAWALFTVRRPVQAFLWFAALPLIILAGDFYLSGAIYGKPLLKIGVMTGSNIGTSVVPADAVYLGHDRWYYMTIPFTMMWNRTGGPVMVIVAAIGLIGGALLWRRLGPLWAWGASVLTLLWLQGGALRPSAPSIRLDIARYSLAFMIPLMFTGVLVIGIMIIALHGPKRWALTATACVLAASAMFSTATYLNEHVGLYPNGGNALREAGDFFASTPGVERANIWSDWGTQRLLPVYTVGPFGGQLWAANDFRSLNRLLKGEPDTRSGPAVGDFVVVYSKADETCYHCREALKDVEAGFGTFPLPGWQEVFTSSAGNLAIYRVGSTAIWPSRRQGVPSSGESQDAPEAP